jgi:hypothetical protein
MLLAAGSLSVSVAADRRSRVAQLATLRVQGLPEAALRLAATGPRPCMVLAAVSIGAFSSVLTRLIVQPSLPIFTDGWRVIPIDTGPRPVPLLLGDRGRPGLLIGANGAG